VRHAITVGHELRARGHELAGVRLDSGDLAHLSIEARRMLDEAGFPAARIVASNDLDEVVIGSLFEQGARIDTFGVGTRLVTGFDQPALGGVYKLGAARDEHGAWHEAIKLSEQPTKISNPGTLAVRRLRNAGELVGDIIYDAEAGLAAPVLHDIEDPFRPAYAPVFDDAVDLLVTYLRAGQPVCEADAIEVARARCARELAELSPRARRFLNPQPYPVGLDPHVHTRKQVLVAEARTRTKAGA
jgi:nicotinate phosphoribosyltransferase